jgi:hypothetical protein
MGNVGLPRTRILRLMVVAFEILQYGSRLPDHPDARFQLATPEGRPLEPVRTQYVDVARDLLRHGGQHPYFVDRSGGSVDGLRISWQLLERLQATDGGPPGRSLPEVDEDQARRPLADASCEIEFWAEPDARYTFRVTNGGYEIKSGTVKDWEEAKLEAIIDLVEPSGEQ